MKIIHQIWIPPKENCELSAVVRSQIRSWSFFHPTYIHKLWTISEIYQAIIGCNRDDVIEAIRRCKLPSQQSDILRLFLLSYYGGVYSDLKIKCRRSFLQNIYDGGNCFFEHHTTSTYIQGSEPLKIMNGVLAGSGDIFSYLLNGVVKNVINQVPGVFSSTGGAALMNLLKAEPRFQDCFRVVPSVKWNSLFSIESGDYNNIKGHWSAVPSCDIYNDEDYRLNNFRSIVSIENLNNPNVKTHIERPFKNGLLVSDTFKFIGWIVGLVEPISHIEITTGCEFISSGKVSLKRYDVEKCNSNFFDSLTSGFSFNVSIEHGAAVVVLEVQAVSNRGTRYHIANIYLNPYTGKVDDNYEC